MTSKGAFITVYEGTMDRDEADRIGSQYYHKLLP